MSQDTARAQRAEGVLALHDALAEGAGLLQVQRLAVREVARHMHGAAALWFDDVPGLTLTCFDHPDAEAREDMERLTAGLVHNPDTLIRQVLAGGLPLVLTGAGVRELLPMMEPPYRAYFAAHGVSAMILQPLRCHDRDVGVLGVSRDEGRPPFTEADVEQVGRMSRILAVAVDSARALTQAQAAEASFAQLALTDPLTGLPNRRAFLEAPSQGGPWLAVVLLDVDGFKHVNDGFGHRAGDIVLSAFARHLQDIASELAASQALVARLGGDEFALLLRGPSADEVRERAQLFAVRAHTQVPLSDLRISVRASAGLAFSGPDAAHDLLTLLQQADLAMYRAKRLGLGHALYDPLADASASRRLRDVAALRDAITGGGLLLHYQRCVPAPDRAPDWVRVEALVRWQRDGVLLFPGAFLPLAAEAGLMPDLTREVIAQTLRQLVGWHRQGVRAQVAVNVSASVLIGDAFPARLDAQVVAAGLPAGCLLLEVTEDEFVDEAAQRAVRACRELGIPVEIDDLGTGFSSLDALLTVPVTGIKLDRSLVAGVGLEPRRRVLLRHIVGLAHELGIEVVAEGIETPADRDALLELGVDLLQGYLLHRPSPAAEAIPPR